MTPQISIEPASASESADIIFVVTLSEASLSDVTVQYRAIADGSALVDSSDFGFRTPEQLYTLTIPAGQTRATINYGSTEYSRTDEFDENFSVQLSNPVGAVLDGGEPVLTATGVFLDDDGSAQDRALFVSDPVILEGDSGTKQAMFEVRLSEAYTDSITLDYTTVDGTAKAGSDYTATSGSITFSAGQTVKSVAVDVRGDTTAETAESFSLVVESTAPIFNNVQDSAGIATLLDDDTSESLPEISVLPSAASESGDLYFDVFLSETSLSDITVQYRAIADGSALVDTSDFGFRTPEQLYTLTIPAGQTHATINYGSTEYSRADEFDENFTLQFSNPDGAVLAGGEPVLAVTGVFLDDDDSAQDRALFVSDPTILEGDSGTK